MAAEKIAIAVEFGPDNTRVRDYFDLWHLAGTYTFGGPTMQRAVEVTFSSRTAGAFLARDDGYWAKGLVPSFATPARERTWRQFGKDHLPNRGLPPFAEVLEQVAFFAIPLLRSARDAFAIGDWTPGCGWRNPGPARGRVPDGP